jgi:DNA-binding transcriptional regulator YdaS (Cro superfamily)
VITKLRVAISESWPGTMDSLAREIHVSPTLLSFWVNARKPIAVWHLLTLSRALQRNPIDLVGMADMGDMGDMAELEDVGDR